MILIISHKSDFTTDFVVNILNQRGIEYRRLNCEDILDRDLHVGIEENFSYCILGRNDYDSVLFRRTKLPEVVGASESERRYLLLEADSLLKNIFLSVNAKWLSDPFFVYRAENKLYQLKVARELGFLVPQTLVTTSKSDLAEFHQRNQGNVVIKPISQTRVSRDSSAFIFTSLLPTTMIDQLDSFDLTPCIFQRNIPKKYEVRVTIVDEKAFAASIDSQADEESRVDWRRKRGTFKAHRLPANIDRLCVDLVRTLGLGFGAIDLIVTPDDEYVFLEINPNGQWVWIETETSLPISDAIIEFLTK